MDFHELWYWGVLIKFANIFQFWCRSGNNKRHFTWRPTWVFSARKWLDAESPARNWTKVNSQITANVSELLCHIYIFWLVFVCCGRTPTRTWDGEQCGSGIIFASSWTCSRSCGSGEGIQALWTGGLGCAWYTALLHGGGSPSPPHRLATHLPAWILILWVWFIDVYEVAHIIFTLRTWIHVLEQFEVSEGYLLRA
jgi:hypothetical protein